MIKQFTQIIPESCIVVHNIKFITLEKKMRKIVFIFADASRKLQSVNVQAYLRLR